MIRKLLIFLIPILILGLFIGSNTELGAKIGRKIWVTVLSFKPHPNYIPVSGTVSESELSSVSVSKNEIPAEPTKLPSPSPVPNSYFLNNLRHEYQSWNNCGPATLAMALSFYNFSQKQKEIAPYLKPDSEDKNVSPQDIVEYVKTQTTYKITYTFNANLLKLKQLASNNIPVIVETWYEPQPNDGMGHYQLVQGYDSTKKELYMHDSYKGPHITISEQKLDDYWKVFNRTILVIYPEDKEQVVKNILGDTSNMENILKASLSNAQLEIEKNQSDSFAWFNLGTTYSLMGKHKEAATSFDKARSLKLPWRMLWYQFSIFDSYLAMGRFQDVVDLTTVNLKLANNLEESLYYRALAQKALNKKDAARADLQNALKYNKNYLLAKEELEKLQ